MPGALAPDPVPVDTDPLHCFSSPRSAPHAGGPMAAARPWWPGSSGNNTDCRPGGASPEGAGRVEYRGAAIGHPKVLPGRPGGCQGISPRSGAGDSLGCLSGGELRCLFMVSWPTGRPRGDGSWPVRGPRVVNRAGSRAGADTAGDRSETARGGSLKVTAAHAAAPGSQLSRSYNGFTCRRRLAVAGLC
jgi:hypothetical protein